MYAKGERQGAFARQPDRREPAKPQTILAELDEKVCILVRNLAALLGAKARVTVYRVVQAAQDVGNRKPRQKLQKQCHVHHPRCAQCLINPRLRCPLQTSKGPKHMVVNVLRASAV